MGEDDSAVEGDASSSDSELDNDLTVPIPRVVSTKTPRHAPSEDDHSPRSHRVGIPAQTSGAAETVLLNAVICCGVYVGYRFRVGLRCIP